MAKKKWIKNILTLLFLAIFVYAAVNLFLIWQGYQQSDALYDAAQVEFLKAPGMEEEFESADPITWPAFSIDFKQLQATNNEVKGWIWIYDTVVNYPLVQSEMNNDAYLHKTYDGTSNNAGSIFMDYRNDSKFQDANTVIYGHNMKNGKMFAILKKFNNQDFYNAHREFYVMTPEGNRHYEVIAAFQTDALSDIYDRTFHNDDAKQAWLNKVLKSSSVLTSVETSIDDSFVTLSTCVSGDDYRARFVVVGRLAEIVPIDTTETTTY